MVCLSTLISVDVSSGLYRGFGMDFGDGIFGFIDLLDWSPFCSSLTHCVLLTDLLPVVSSLVF